MAEKSELRAEIDALRAEVAALRSEVRARTGWVQVIQAPAYPYYPTTMPTITCGTSTDNPAHLRTTALRGMN